MSAIKNRKVVIPQYGDASKLTIVSEDLAAPDRNHVQVRIVYAGFSGADVNMRLGLYPMQKTAPLTPGYCFAGRVAANGPGAGRFKPGDRVTALTVYDADSEYLNVPERYLVPVPADVPLQQTAALCVDWTTAYGMVARSAGVAEGQRVFIHGLSGAVGQALMMLCQLRGAVVYGTASERNHAGLRERGAHPFVYTNKEWIAAMQDLGGMHAVFDPLGFESFDESYSILSAKERSILVAYGNNLNSLKEGKPRSIYYPMLKLLLRNLCFWSKKSTTFFYITREQKTFQPELQSLMEMVKEDKIRVPIKRVWDMDAIKEAHQSWGRGPGMGSIIIRVSSEE